MSSRTGFGLWWRYTGVLLLLLLIQSLGLSTDGVLLLSFKYSVISDPLSVLASWNYDDVTPCSWNGVLCTGIGIGGDGLRVISLALPKSQLLGPIPPELGMIEHLRHLDLSSNLLNGSLPASLFNASELQSLTLSNNLIIGSLPDSIAGLKSLELLNLSDNALAGKIPDNLHTLANLTVLSLGSNYFSGGLPNGFQALEVLDLSSNLINGSLPSNFAGEKLGYLNLSYNRLRGEIPPDFAKSVPANATLDLSFNNLTGEIPESGAFLHQKSEAFAGNPALCGKPLKKQCTIPSSPSSSPNVSRPTSAPAIAVLPKPIDSTPPSAFAGNSTNTTQGTQQQGQSGLRPEAIVGIVVGDLVGIVLLSLILLYVYQLKKKKKVSTKEAGGEKKASEEEVGNGGDPSSSTDKKGLAWSCLRKKGTSDEGTSETTGSDEDEEEQISYDEQQRGGKLVTVDGETELELETLLKASAYILGATGTSIVYKAVLEDGTTLAVRRIGDESLEKFKDFENEIKQIAKLRHPNLVRIRGFFWGSDEKLIIYDYVPNGSLAHACSRKPGSSPYQLPWETRLNIARGVGRGLAYLHEKKHVHGNLKPSNILLGLDMEPIIVGFGLERLVSLGDNSYKSGGSARQFGFGSKRSVMSRDSLQEQPPMGASPSTSTSAASLGGATPYMAPESLKNLKPNPKWDVYSFGVILLELLTGKMISERELVQWNTWSSAGVEDSNRLLRMADVAVRADVEVLLACFKLGLACTLMLPQKRPSMKEALQVLDKMPSSHHPFY